MEKILAIRKVITINQDIEFLRKVSKPVTSFGSSLNTLLDDMWDTLEKYNGAGLSAVQIGVLKRVFIINIKENIEFINPEILEISQLEKKEMEGCLSVPKEYHKINRPTWVKVRAQDRNGKVFERVFKGYQARAICHENDHLDGKLYIDLLTKEDEKK